MKIRKWLLMLIICVIFITFTRTVVAKEESMDTMLYVSSRECPERIVDYAKANYVDYALSYFENHARCECLILGTPFSVSNSHNNMFYFPIFDKGRVILVLRVAEDDEGIYGTISNFLSQELNNVLEDRSKEVSEFYIFDSAFYMRTGEQITKVMDFPLETSFISWESQRLFDQEKMIIVNICEDIEVRNITSASRDTISSYIALPITETQGSSSWCQAYCTAAIARYRGFSGCTAYDVMAYTYGSNPSTGLNLADGRVVAYAHAIGLNSVTNSASYLDNNILKNHINAFRPVTLVMRNKATGGYHATVLRGYNSTHWSIWNPWYSSYESFQIGQNYVTQRGTIFQYGSASGRGRTIYNW